MVKFEFPQAGHRHDGTGERTRVLSGWKEIASYLGRGVRTVQRWEKLGLPVRRPNAHLRSAVLTNTEEVDSWMRTCGSGRGDGFAHDSEYQMLRELVDQLRHDNDELRREVDLLKCRVSGPRSAANVESSVSTQVA